MKFSISWCIFILLGLSLSAYSDIDVDDLENKTEAELIEELYLHRFELQEWFLSGFNGGLSPKQGITCTLCQTLIIVVINWVRDGLTLEEIIPKGQDLCKSVELVAEDICDSVVPIYADPLVHIIEYHPWINRFDICGIVLGGQVDNPCGLMNASMTSWTISVDEDKPALIEPPLLPADVPTVKVIHLTDIHPDLHYAEGSLNDCGRPLCCRPDPLDDPTNTSIAAGVWGDFLCDFPIHSTAKLFMDAAAQHADADFVLMTGDLVHHTIWNTTVQDNLNHYAAVRKALLDDAFPDKKVYPAIGNHEPHPCNMFPPQEVWETFDLSWLYNTQAEMYANHLTPEALATFRMGGYYTLVHKPGFRIVTLNTNFCYTFNFWIIYNAVDPEGQLQWFSDVMADAEAAGEKVWVVGHVPPGSSDCWHVWSKQFQNVINRYEAIIMAQFYGHTHNDDIRIFFDQSVEPPRPTGSLYIGASVTPYTDLNPGYKVFFADGAREGDESTWEIVDHETWVYNLTQANRAGLGVEPVWYKVYSAKEEYGLKSLRPVDLYEFVERMAKDNELFLKFIKNWYKDSGRDFNDEDCATSGDVTECKFEFICPIVDTDYKSDNCNRLKEAAKM